MTFERGSSICEPMWSKNVIIKPMSKRRKKNPFRKIKQIHKRVSACQSGHSFTLKRGRKQGYPSRVGAGKGHILGHSIIWAGAVRPKTAKKQKSKE